MPGVAVAQQNGSVQALAGDGMFGGCFEDFGYEIARARDIANYGCSKRFVRHFQSPSRRIGFLRLRFSTYASLFF
jgi:hypothetical protein